MKIGGFQQISLNEFPGRIAAIIFTQGCNFRCPYCHNPELVKPELFSDLIPEAQVLDFLERRRGKLDGVSITGGEPLLQPDLLFFLDKVKKMGYEVKLDTNGSEPEILERLIKERLVDYLAMDIKGPSARYAEIVRTQLDIEKIRRSIAVIMASSIDYEFRTTLVPSLINDCELAEAAHMIDGAKRYVLQRFHPSKLLDKNFSISACFSPDEWARMQKEAQRYVADVVCRS